MAFVDDVGAVIPLEDVLDFCNWFQSACNKYGTEVNTQKTCILTSTTGVSHIPELQQQRPEVAASLQQAIATFSQDDDGHPLEITTGIRYLGLPIGQTEFGTTFLNNHADTIDEAADAVFSHLGDRQTIFQLMVKCVLAKAPHLLPANIYHHTDTTKDFATPFEWSGPFTQRSNQCADTCLKKYSQSPTSPHMSPP
jgi:hypothetical protein